MLPNYDLIDPDFPKCVDPAADHAFEMQQDVWVEGVRFRYALVCPRCPVKIGI